MSRRSGYSALQIGLHWLVAVLIFAAYFASDGMGDALRDRVERGASGIEGNTLHVWLGGTVLALVLVRIAVRLARGAPGPAEGTSAALAAAATWGHRLIYVLMVMVPLGGAVAWYGGIRDVGEVLAVAGNLLMLVVVGHVLVAILHEAVARDGTMRRMLRPEA
ncbi:cytochrome b [Palleronia sp. KMU-117]|uniref:cytochrome b n=1 Tax=Palleronia sp. KMU-117 TaxID=3434108 RepID=UPI003D726493